MEIGMGGTVAKLVATGSAVVSIVLTDGRRSPNPFSWSAEQMVSIRKREAMDAAAVLGIDVQFIDAPELWSPANFKNAKEHLRGMLSELCPVEIYTHHSEFDRHPTHQQAGRLTLEALGEIGLSSPYTLWAYEVWGLFPKWDRLEIIDAYIALKIKAISAHKSQIASIPYTEGIIGLNRWRAVFADPGQHSPPAIFAEAFIRLSPS
jgi:LmbE family N-acetylglucosaminyl deacetylase